MYSPPHPSTLLPTHSSVHLSIHPPTSTSTLPSTLPPTHSSFHPSIFYPSIHPSIITGIAVRVRLLLEMISAGWRFFTVNSLTHWLTDSLDLTISLMGLSLFCWRRPQRHREHLISANWHIWKCFFFSFVWNKRKKILYWLMKQRLHPKHLIGAVMLLGNLSFSLIFFIFILSIIEQYFSCVVLCWVQKLLLPFRWMSFTVQCRRRENLIIVLSRIVRVPRSVSISALWVSRAQPKPESLLGDEGRAEQND